MANYRKSFNFRNGVQVDNDNFIVNANGLVGIGTSIPTEVLDVNGNITVSGVVTTSQLYVIGVSTLTGNVVVGTGVTIFSSLGIVSATSFRGDGTQLTGIDGSKWKVDAIAGLTTMSDVGIGTTDPVDKFQVGENPVTGVGVGIDSRGQGYFSGITTAGAYSTSGFVNTGDLNVTGVSTFTGAIDANGALDVDGDTQVDDLNVAGVATFSSLIDANNRLDVVGGANIDQINVSGVSTFIGIVTTSTDLFVGGDLYVKDDIEFDEVTARLGTFTGTLDVSGNIDANGTLDVDGDTQVDDLNVAGVATFSSGIDANSTLDVDGNTTLDNLAVAEGATIVGGATIDQANVTGVSTFTGAIDANGALDVDGDTQLDDLNVAGVATFSALADVNNRLDVTGGANIDQLNVTGVSTFTGALTFTGASTFTGNIDANGTLDVDGDTQVDDLNVAGVSTFASNINANGNIVGDNSTNISGINSITAVTIFGESIKIAVPSGGTSGLSTFYGLVRYGNENVSFPYSTRRSVDLLNYDSENVNFYLDANNIGINTGAFYWHKGSNGSRLMTLTSEGNLGIGITLPEYQLHVSGIATCTDFYTSNNATIKNDLSVAGDITVTGNLESNVKGDILSPDGTTILDNGTGSGENSLFAGNINATTGLSTVAILNTNNYIGIGTTNQRAKEKLLIYETPESIGSDALPAGSFVEYGVYVGMSTFIASAGVHTSIDRFTVSEWDYKTIEYTVHIIQPNGKMQGEKVLFIQNGTTGFSTNICSISNSSSIVSVAGTINGTESELIVTPEPTMTGMTTYRFVRRTLL